MFFTPEGGMLHSCNTVSFTSFYSIYQTKSTSCRSNFSRCQMTSRLCIDYSIKSTLIARLLIALFLFVIAYVTMSTLNHELRISHSIVGLSTMVDRHSKSISQWQRPCWKYKCVPARGRATTPLENIGNLARCTSIKIHLIDSIW